MESATVEDDVLVPAFAENETLSANCCSVTWNIDFMSRCPYQRTVFSGCLLGSSFEAKREADFPSSFPYTSSCPAWLAQAPFSKIDHSIDKRTSLALVLTVETAINSIGIV
jgi:hypothetical protein